MHRDGRCHKSTEQIATHLTGHWREDHLFNLASALWISSGHIISWAGFCPRNDESAGKRRSTRLRKGAPWLKTLLVQCAWRAVRTKNTYLQAQFLRPKARRGPKKAIMAVAASC